MIEKSFYAKALEKADRNLAKNVSEYLKDANEENVHDLRTSIRRVLAAIQVFPKKIRTTNKVATYADNLEKLMKSNAKTRDLDIIIAKVRRKTPATDYSSLLKQLEKSRDSSLPHGIAFARSLRHDLGLEVKQKDLSSSELDKRFEKIIRKYVSKLQQRLPVVVSTPDDKEELHLLRWDARKLRYILEFGDPKALENPLKLLKSWQEVLGEVHDSDIFIRFFAKSKRSHETNRLLEEEANDRNQNYEKFKKIAESPLGLEA